MAALVSLQGLCRGAAGVLVADSAPFPSWRHCAPAQAYAARPLIISLPRGAPIPQRDTSRPRISDAPARATADAWWKMWPVRFSMVVRESGH